MSSLLGKIKGFVDNFATVIADILDTDVIITDSNMNIVGSKFKYFSLYNEIRIGTLIADVIMNNHKLIIDDKNKVASCRECAEFDICKMKGFVGVPIQYEQKVLGAIALILPKAKVKSLFYTVDSTIAFMENMADLVAIRMVNHMEKKGLKQRIFQIESILDLMEDAVLYTDIYGNIIYQNRRFKTEFQVDNSIIGKNIVDIYSEFEPWMNEKNRIENLKVTIDYRSGVFYGLLNRKQIYVSEEEHGLIFCFQPHKNISISSSAFIQGTIVTVSWLDKICDSEWSILAQKYSMGENNLLIYSREGIMNELLAKAIANNSSRRLNEIKIIYINSIYRDLLDTYLLGEYGMIRAMDEGTLILISPEQMPLYVQDRLAEYICTGKLKMRNRSYVEVDVRIIFCTTVDVRRLSESGNFSRELYRCISANIIAPEHTIHNHRLSFEKYCSSGLKYYSKIYKKKKKIITAQLLECLWNDCKDMQIEDLECVLEGIVRNESYQGMKVGLYEEKNLKPKLNSMKEMEENQLRHMVEMGYNRREIENTLKISRTTLYRRLKEYDIDMPKVGKANNKLK